MLKRTMKFNALAIAIAVSAMSTPLFAKEKTAENYLCTPATETYVTEKAYLYSTEGNPTSSYLITGDVVVKSGSVINGLQPITFNDKSYQVPAYKLSTTNEADSGGVTVGETTTISTATGIYGGRVCAASKAVSYLAEGTEVTVQGVSGQYAHIGEGIWVKARNLASY